MNHKMTILQVRLAESEGAVGVLLYLDTEDSVSSSKIYPNGLYATGKTCPYITLRLQGDLLTPNSSSAGS